MAGVQNAFGDVGKSGLATLLLALLGILGALVLSPSSALALPPNDELTIVSVLDSAGDAIVPIPVYLRDRAGTPIGSDAPPGRTIQGLSLSVAYYPPELVLSIDFQRAGVAVAASPFLERSESGAGVYSWIAMYDETADPLVLSSDPPAPGDLIGHLLVSIPALPLGTEIELALLEDYNSLANRSGSHVEQSGRRLALTGGYLGVGVLLFQDGFETGDTKAWSSSLP